MGKHKQLIGVIIFLFILISSYGQDRTVKGIVYDDKSGETMPGVSVMVKGTTLGSITDLSGIFTSKLTSDNDILVFSFIGMESQEIPVGGRTYIEVRLKPTVKVLDEVIITAMGISRSSKSLGYAASNLKSDDISSSRESNVINALTGKVAGIQISSSSGGVGSSSRILIRGISSLSSDNQPLFVVDGIPVNNSLRSGTGDIDWGNAISDFNSEDIAEITVLKGAGAAALYGSQAANGVIVIKTKSGKDQKGLGIEYNGSVSFESPFRLPSFQNKYGPGMNPESWDFWASGEEPYYAWGPPLDAGLMAVQWNSPIGKGGQPEQLPLKSYKNNFRDFFETGFSNDNNISFSKNEDNKYHFRLSYNNMKETGMLYNTDLTRNVVSMNAGTHITKRIEITTSALYSKSFSGNRLWGNGDAYNAVKSALFMPRSVNVDDLRNYQQLLENGVPLPGEYLGKNLQVVAPNYTMATTDYYPNPFFTLENLKNEMNNDRLFGVIGANIELATWLRFDMKASKEQITELYQVKSNDGVRHWNGSIYSYKGFYTRNQTIRDNTTTNFRFTFIKDLKFVNIQAFLGGERRDNIMDWGNMNAPELEVPGVFNMSNTKGTKQVSNGYYHTRLNSLFGSIDFSFNNGLYFTVTGRNDWSSTLPQANRSYYYPSASLSWVASESFKLPKSVSFAKLRLNASQVGSDTWAYQLENSFYNLDRIGGIYEAAVGKTLKNPNLKPTRTNQYEVGLDLRFFDSRFNVDLTLYQGTSFDQITPVNVASSTGYTNRYVNIGEIANKGIELTLTSTPVKLSTFRWDLGLTYSKNRNEVLSLADDVDALTIGSGYSGIRTEARPGSAYGAIIGYGLKRDPNGNVILVNGLPVKGDHEEVLGNITPDWLGSLSTSIRYKQIRLSAIVNAKMGGDLFSLTTQWLRQYGMDEATDVPLRQGYIIGDGVIEKNSDGNVTYVPNDVSVAFSDYSYWYNAYGLHETSIFDASYIKLSELRLSYDVPQSWAKKISANQITISFVGRNLALLYSNIPHVDPETSMSADNSKQGFEIFNMPSARKYTFNLYLKF